MTFCWTPGSARQGQTFFNRSSGRDLLDPRKCLSKVGQDPLSGPAQPAVMYGLGNR